jgi:hypothetical protein
VAVRAAATEAHAMEMKVYQRLGGERAAAAEAYAMEAVAEGL